MSKKNKIIISVIILFLVGGVGICKFSFRSVYKITIDNKTDETIKNLELKYKFGNKIQTIAQIQSKKSWKETIDTNTIEGETAIILEYRDDNGKDYREYVVGYLEKGYSGRTTVNINSIDEQGKLEIDIKD